MSKLTLNFSTTIYNDNCIADKLLGLTNVASGNAASAAYPQANMVLYVPFVALSTTQVTQMFWYNGTGTGNMELGIYTEDGIKLASSGVLAMSGTNTSQFYTFPTPVNLGEGLYFVAVVMNNTTNRLFSVTGTNPGFSEALGLYQQTGTFPLPANASFQNMTTNYIPFIGLTGRGLV